MLFSRHRTDIIGEDQALRGRDEAMAVPERHSVLGSPLRPPFPDAAEQAVFGMGCFWGAERKFWETPGLFTTAVGYAGGFIPNPFCPKDATPLVRGIVGGRTTWWCPSHQR